jgi:hypothetical protein
MFQLACHIRHHSSRTLQALHQQARIVELQHLADGLQQRLQEQEQQLASYATPYAHATLLIAMRTLFLKRDTNVRRYRRRLQDVEGLYEQKQKAFATAARRARVFTRGFGLILTCLLQVLATAPMPAQLPSHPHPSSSSSLSSLASSSPAKRFGRGSGGAPDAWNEFMERVSYCFAS